MLQKFTQRVPLFSCILTIILIYGCHGNTNGHSDQNNKDSLELTVDSAVRPVMQQFNIPGMAIGVTMNGKRYFYNYGITSKNGRQDVTNETIFEIGSVSKTFNATLAAYAESGGYLSLSDTVSKHLPSLQGTPFDKIQLLNLGTHTAGGLPLQLPDEIKDSTQLMNYYRQWQPDFPAGTYREYSNPSIALLGIITAHSMHQPYVDLIEKQLLPELGMTNSFINVPADKMNEYAQGYNKMDSPVRVNPGIIAPEAYGIKSCTRDMIQFEEANMGMSKANGNWQQAILKTHTGYFKSGVLTQDLIWEQYSYPMDPAILLAGNGDSMIYNPNPASKISPPLPPKENVLINKTGSTNGFSAYVLFVPSRKLGIVLLANKSFPIPSRVGLVYHILAQLEKEH